MTADSGEQGIETARSKKPNLIFLDNRMEGISGIETLQHLRTAAPSSMVILMTAFGTSQTAIEAMKHAQIDPTRRAETLSITEWVTLAQYLNKARD